MKIIAKISLLLLIPVLVHAQQHLPDSIIRALKSASNDSLRYRANIQAYLYFEEINRDSALYYVNQTLFLARKNDKQLLIARALANNGYQLTNTGHYPEALKNLLQAFSIAQNPKNASSSWLLAPEPTPEKSRLLILCLTHHMFGILMDRTQNTEQVLFHFKEGKRLATEINNPQRILIADMNIGNTYIDLNRIDSALIFENEAKDIAIKIGQKKYLSYILTCFGDIALKKGNKAKAKQFYYEGIHSAIEQNNIATLMRGYLKLTSFYLAENEKDSSLYFATKMLETIKILGPTTSQQINIGVAYENLYNSYKLRKQLDSAFKYAGLALIAKDSIFKKRIENLAQFQTLSFREQLHLQDLEKEKVVYQNTIRTYALLAGLGVFLVIALILYRNNKQKHKANKILENTLTNLETTQTQLIQSEKLASLGELTAGIAHEIQNPLNFVNNFSEVSMELAVEIKDELKLGNIDEVIDIVDNIEQNLEKIIHHGKRADAIVKNMLQHSRNNSAEKTLTDINALADEYLRLSYHGLRAKDKSFNSNMSTDFDSSVPKVEMIGQDIGRVLLNLFNNAFYAVQQRKKADGDSYKPEVKVSTKLSGKFVEIKVTDNGTGIPDNVKGKILQPFFTTKPTGEGTGLGLSLSYDIVVKGHGGTMDIKSVDGEYTEFIINIPV